jgi:hypothetical protein
MTQPRLPDTRDLELRLPDMRGFELRFPDRRGFDPRFPDMWDLEPRLPGPPIREGSPTGWEGRGAVHSPGVGGMGRDEP